MPKVTADNRRQLAHSPDFLAPLTAALTSQIPQKHIQTCRRVACISLRVGLPFKYKVGVVTRCRNVISLMEA